MNSRRTVIIGAALMLALLAFLGNVMYLKNVKDQAYGKATLVKVFVVKKAIPKGSQGDLAISQGWVRAGEIPQEFRPGSAISNIDDIRSKVAITDLSPGQVVVTGQFVDPSVAQVTFAQRVPAGQVAITVSVDQVHGVAGLLMPGDAVDIMVTNGTGDTAVMYQNVNILAIGAKAAPTVGDSTATAATKDNTQATSDSGLITFAVPLAAAQHLASVASGSANESMYLALVPPSAPTVATPGQLKANDLLNNLPVTPY